MHFFIAIILAFTVTFLLVPLVIRVSKSIDLLDIPDVRKIHQMGTPSLGGIAIFWGFLTALIFALSFVELGQIKFYLIALFLMFLLGVSDDVSSLRPHQKLLIQLFSAFLVVYYGGISLTGFYGIFGIQTMPVWFTSVFSIFVIVVLTNSFNLIDGIDGLAGSIGALILTVFGWVFLSTGDSTYAIICLSMAGSLIAFLFFNWAPSRVFMGDTGSMILGFTISTLAIRFINMAPEVDASAWVTFQPSVGICIGLLILPIFDTIRVFAIRFKEGRSPLSPDRNHIHHGLLNLGMTHSQATTTLFSVNVLFVVMSLVLGQWLNNAGLMLALMLLATGGGLVLDVQLYQKRNEASRIKIETRREIYLSKSA